MSTATQTATAAAPTAATDVTAPQIKGEHLGLVVNPDEQYPVLKVDFSDNTYWLDTEYKSNRSITFHQAHGHMAAYTLHQMTNAAGFGTWAAEHLAPLVGRIHAGYESVWNGNNNVARFDEDALAAKDELEELLGAGERGGLRDPEYPTLPTEAGFVEAASWLECCDDAGLGIHPGSTEEEIEAAAAEHVAAARGDWYVMEQDAAVKYLRQRVEAARESAAAAAQESEEDAE